MKTLFRGSMLLLTLATLAIARPVLAQSDQDNTAHTGWNWLKNQTATQLTDYLTSHNARITDLQAANKAGTRFDAVVVSNSGAYAKTEIWFPKMTPVQAVNYALNHSYRITVVAPYLITNTTGTTLYVAVAMISNTGADAASWDLYYGSATGVVNAILGDGDRAIQFKPYGVTSTGNAGYIGVGVKNSSGRSWAALTQVTPTQINSQINSGYRVVELMSDVNGSYTALFDNLNVGWLWWYNVSSDFLWGTTTYYSARPISISPNGKNWNGVEIQN